MDISTWVSRKLLRPTVFPSFNERVMSLVAVWKREAKKKQRNNFMYGIFNYNAMVKTKSIVLLIYFIVAFIV